MANIDWESRAKQRSKELKRANKKIREEITSRDLWKQKYIDRETEIKVLKKQLAIVKKNLQQIMDL
jgi:bacterioferritin (cytochrome b1)